MKNLKFFVTLFGYWAKRKEPICEIFLKGKKVLDLGCGPTSIVLKDKENFEGIDLNERVINDLKSRGYNVKHGSVLSTGYVGDRYDVVFSSNVIEHLNPTEARDMIIEAARLLKVHGKLIIITPMPRTVWNTFGHIKPYTPMSIKKLLRTESYESFDAVTNLKILNTFYYGAWGRNKLTFLISTMYSNIFPSLAGSHMTILERIH